jgi:hypothetical protein
MTNRKHAPRFFSLKSNKKQNGLVLRVCPDSLEDITNYYEFTLVKTTADGRFYESKSTGDQSPILGIRVKKDCAIKAYKPKRPAYITELTPAKARSLREAAENWRRMQLWAGVYDAPAPSQIPGTPEYARSH